MLSPVGLNQSLTNPGGFTGFGEDLKYEGGISLLFSLLPFCGRVAQHSHGDRHDLSLYGKILTITRADSLGFFFLGGGEGIGKMLSIGPWPPSLSLST